MIALIFWHPSSAARFIGMHWKGVKADSGDMGYPGCRITTGIAGVDGFHMAYEDTMESQK